MNDLTGFKRDALRGIATLDETSGLALKEWLEDEAGYGHVNHGRIYPNLDDLATMGLIRKEREDGRTNSYTLTRRGEREIVQHTEEWTAAVAHLGVPVETDGGESGLDALFPERGEE